MRLGARLIGVIVTALVLVACSSEPVDPWPDAEVAAWALVGRGEKPPTVYLPEFYRDGIVDGWERTVYVLRTPETAPADSFLCYGYALAAQIVGPHDPYLSPFDFDFPAALDQAAACSSELAR